MTKTGDRTSQTHRSNRENRLTREQTDRVWEAKRARDESGPVGGIICENCSDNCGHAQLVDAVRLTPPRITDEEWCYSCVRAGVLLRRVRHILPTEHDYE